MRYVDTGSRDPKQALGAWLDEVLIQDTSVVSVRVQTGFFGADALGYFEPTLARLASSDGLTHFLIGSNDGETTRADLENLLAMAGPARPGLKFGVVSFTNAFFHPKVFHFKRADGSATAYVGSANLTRAGVVSQHVESGFIVDTRGGDPHKVLRAIADAIDGWFIMTRGGFHPFSTSSDLEALAQLGIIDVPSPARPPRIPSESMDASAEARRGAMLKPLLHPPAATGLAIPSNSSPTSPTRSTVAVPKSPSAPLAPREPTSVEVHWSKTISTSDAQRKPAGNQSGAIALTQGHYQRKIDQTTFFRYDLFGREAWAPEAANTGQPKEVTTVKMHVEVDGVYHGELGFRVSNASNRESGQNNYTAQLHLEPLTPLFTATDMSQKTIEIERMTDGTYRLTIS